MISIRSRIMAQSTVLQSCGAVPVGAGAVFIFDNLLLPPYNMLNRTAGR